jgi:uncharacterized membrane protein
MMTDFKPNTNWLRTAAIILLILGIFFRFVNLDQKIYWRDEALTSLQVPGYTISEVTQILAESPPLTIGELRKYQQINPQRGLTDTLKSFATETPEHPPLYYIIMRFWMQWFGSSVTAMRSLSAILSLLVFPSLYWLCIELFESPLVAWVAIALISISPFHVLYAQEAREYSLWTATILLASAALLRALRLNNPVSWLIYTATLALAFYSYLFSAFVAVGHGIYVIILERFRFTKKLIYYLGAAIAGGIIFLPWILVVIINLPALQRSMAWINYRFTVPELILRWVFNTNRIFVDWNYGWSFKSPFPYLIILAVLILVGYALYFLCRQTSMRVWLFVLTLSGVTALALVLPDLIVGGGRSKILRYLIPFYLGIQLAVAYLLTVKTSGLTTNIRQQQIWKVITFILLSAGVISCSISASAEVWWHKSDTQDVREIAQSVNQCDRPLIISDAFVSNALSLSHNLNDRVSFQLVNQPATAKISEGFSDVFLFAASKPLRQQLEQKYQIKFVRFTERLWKLEK